MMISNSLPRICLSFFLLLCSFPLCGCSQVWTALWGDPYERSQDFTEKSRRALEAGELDEAARYLKQASLATPEDGEIFRRLAKLQKSQGKNRAAIQTYQQLLKRESQDSAAWVELAQLHYEEDDTQQADFALSQALNTNPENLLALSIKAGKEEERELPVQALETYHRILHVDPTNTTARLGIARIQLTATRPERAAPLLREVCDCPLASASAQQEARKLLGIAYGQEERWEEAAVVLRSALDPQSVVPPEEWYRIAYAHWKAGQLSHTVTILNHLNQYAPEFAPAARLASLLGGSALIASGATASGATMDGRVISAGHQDLSAEQLIPVGW